MAPLPVVRFLACGSVDDGKSTLLGRLVYELGQVPEDVLAALAEDSARHGTRRGGLDFSLLLDGLSAEREQGITVDVAWRYFQGPGRRYVVADTPGHAQYTRNMVTGASNADAAVLLVDARQGLLPQTLRHARICAWVGIRHFALAVNKLDLVHYSEGPLLDAERAFAPLARELGVGFTAIPVSAVEGDNVTARSPRMPWYRGPTLLEWLEALPPSPARTLPAALPIQYVVRAAPDFRGLAGRLATGTLRPGTAVRVLPSGRAATVRRLVSPGGPLEAADAGDSVLVELDGHVDAARGDVLAADGSPVVAAEEFRADLVWMGEAPLSLTRRYVLRLHAAEVTASVSAVHHRVDVEAGGPVAVGDVSLNDLAHVTLRPDRHVALAPYGPDRVLGALMLLDRATNEVVAAGMVREVEQPSRNLAWQALTVDKAARARAKGQRPRCIWFTGLPGSGKSTLADLLERALAAAGQHTYLLDGDNVRHGLNRDLGFSPADRAENIRRVAEAAKLMVDAGLVVLVAFISPYRAERERARALFEPGEFFEVFVDAPLAECEARDPKGLYARARRGELPDFTGVSSPYEPPGAPEFHAHTGERTAGELVEALLAALA